MGVKIAAPTSWVAVWIKCIHVKYRELSLAWDKHP